MTDSLCGTCHNDDCPEYMRDNFLITSECSEYMEKSTQAMIDHRIRGLLKIFHIPETDEQVKIVIKTLKQQAEYVKARDKILTFLDRFKVKQL